MVNEFPIAKAPYVNVVHDPYGIWIDIDFEVRPQVIDGNTMVPMRALFESIGFVTEDTMSLQYGPKKTYLDINTRTPLDYKEDTEDSAVAAQESSCQYGKIKRLDIDDFKKACKLYDGEDKLLAEYNMYFETILEDRYVVMQELYTENPDANEIGYYDSSNGPFEMYKVKYHIYDMKEKKELVLPAGIMEHQKNGYFSLDRKDQGYTGLIKYDGTVVDQPLLE